MKLIKNEISVASAIPVSPFSKYGYRFETNIMCNGSVTN